MIQPKFKDPQTGVRPSSSPRLSSSARRLIPVFFLVLAAVLVPSSCRKTHRPRNFILITLDTQRADHISAYTPDYAFTPNIDSLARQGVLFKNCYSLIPITLPAHASLFFSEAPHELKNYNNGQVLLQRKRRPPLSALFQKNGFRTAAFVSLGVLKSHFGLSEGFDVYRDDFPGDRWYLSADEVNRGVLPWLEENKNEPFFLWVHYSDPHDPYAPPDAPPDMKVTFNGDLLGDAYFLSKYITYDFDVTLEEGRNRFLLEVENPFYPNPDHFQARLDMIAFDPPAGEDGLDIQFVSGWFIRRSDNVYFFKKQGYIDVVNSGPAKPFRMTIRGKLILPVEEAVRPAYRREVEFMDQEIGKLWAKMSELGLFETTAVVVVGDHGEGLGEHMSPYADRHIGHIHYLYEQYMKVPLILYNPLSREQGRIREETVTLLDIAPTVTNLMGFKTPGFYRGRDLYNLETGETLSFFQETYRPEAVRERFGLWEKPWHLIYTPEDNHLELFNILDDPGEERNLIQEKGLAVIPPEMKRALEKFARDVLAGKVEVKIDKHTEEMLKSLGYIRN